MLFRSPANAVMFFGVLGFLLSAPSWADKSSSRPAAKAPPAGAALLAAGYCLVLMRAAALPAAAAWLAVKPALPVERVVGLARAISLDADPDLIARLSVASYKAAGEDPQADFALLRLSLRYALAAAEHRPFTSDVLYLAGATLRRLGRPDDSGELFARAASVRFARFEPYRPNAAQRREKNLETLRELKLVAPKEAAR